MRLNNKSKK